MNGSAAKVSRRQIRRSLGPEGLALVSKHDEFLTHQARGNQQVLQTIDQLIAHVTRIQTQVDALTARPQPQTLRQRLRWLLTGR